MSNKHIAVLLLPALILLVAAAGAFLISQQALERPNPNQNQERFERFVNNVQSGKWQLTTDKWLAGMRSEHGLAVAERGARLQLAESMRNGVWWILGGIGFEAIVIFWVRSDLRNRSP